MESIQIQQRGAARVRKSGQTNDTTDQKYKALTTILRNKNSMCENGFFKDFKYDTLISKMCVKGHTVDREIRQ